MTIYYPKPIAAAAALCALPAAYCQAIDDSGEKPYQLSPMTVTATRTERLEFETPGSVATLELDQLNVSSLQHAFKDQPLITVPFAFSGSGVAYQRSGSQSVNIRGIEGNRILLQVDGVRLPDEFQLGGSEPIGRDYIDPDLYKRVEAIKGSASALYGSDAIGGVVSFVTKDPSDYLSLANRSGYASAGGSYRSADDSLSATFTGARPFGAWQALLIHTRRTGEEIENNGDVAPNPLEFDSQATLLKLARPIGERHQFGLALEHYERDWTNEVDNKETASFFGGVTEHLSQESLTERLRASLSYTYQAGRGQEGWFDSLEAHVYAQDAETRDRADEQIVYDPPSRSYGSFRNRDIETSFHNDSHGLSLNAVKNVNDAHRLAYGVEYSHVNTRKPWSADIESGFRGEYTQSSLRMANTDTTRLGAYLQDEIEWHFGENRKLVLIPGLRIEQFELEPDNSPQYLEVTAGAAAPGFEETAAAPKLGALVTLSKSVNLYGQYNHGFRYPSAEDLTATFTNPIARYRTLPNPNLVEEESDAYEMGLKGQFGQALTLRVAAFHTDYQNFIEQIAFAPMPYQDFQSWPSGTFMTQNRADARIYGAEVSARLDFAAIEDRMEGLSLRLSIGRAKGDFRSDEGERLALDTVDPLRATARLSYIGPSARFGGNFGLSYADERDFEDDSRFQIPSHTVADFGLWWRAAERLTVNLDVENLFDEKYWVYSSVRGLAATNVSEQERRTQPGINGALSLRYEF